MYYYGARYLDPKYSRWISTDPALGDYIPNTPINEEAKRQNQDLPGMGGVFNTVNANLYHYAGNNPVKYTDPDGREVFNFSEFLKSQIYAEGYALDAGFRDILGKIGNSFVNIFTGNASYQVYAKASLNILNIDCNIFDLKIGSEGQNLSFSLEKEVANEFIESFEKIIGKSIVITTSKFKVKIGKVSFTLRGDGNNLKVNVNIGKNKSMNLGKLGEGGLNICAGINITTNMNEGPFGTIENRQSAAIEKDKVNYNYYNSINRLFD